MKKLICWIMGIDPIEVWGSRYWRKISDGPFTQTRYTPVQVRRGWVRLEVRYDDGDGEISMPIRKFYRKFTLY